MYDVAAEAVAGASSPWSGHDIDGSVTTSPARPYPRRLDADPEWATRRNRAAAFQRLYDDQLWFWANQRGALPPRATTAKAARKAAAKRHFKYEGHQRARTR